MNRINYELKHDELKYNEYEICAIASGCFTSKNYDIIRNTSKTALIHLKIGEADTLCGKDNMISVSQSGTLYLIRKYPMCKICLNKINKM